MGCHWFVKNTFLCIALCSLRCLGTVVRYETLCSIILASGLSYIRCYGDNMRAHGSTHLLVRARLFGNVMVGVVCYALTQLIYGNGML